MTIPLTLPATLGAAAAVVAPEDPWAPYRPPHSLPRGWRVGPAQASAVPAQGSAVGLDAQVTVDQANVMDVAVSSGACINGSVAITFIVDSNNGMLAAAATGAGLPAAVTVDEPNTAGLATGDGAALAPVLTVVNPAVYDRNAANDTGPTSSGSTMTTTWTHPAGGANRAVLVFVANNSQSGTYGAITCTYGGAAMTLLGTAYLGPTPGERFVVYGLTGRSASAATVLLSTDRNVPNVHIEGISISYTGVSGFGAVISNAAISAAPTQSVTPVTGAASVVHGFCAYPGFPGVTGYTGATERVNAPLTWPMNAGDGIESTYSITGTLPSSVRWASIGVHLLP